MASYSIDVYAIADATTNVAGIIEQYKGGNQWDWNASSNPTLSVNSGASTTSVAITDTDAGGAGATLDDDTTGQTLTSDTVIGGVTYTAGSVIEDEYEINLSDGLGNTYRFVAISINDTIIGFTWEGTPPPQGTTLSYTSGNTFDTQSMVPCFASGTVIDTPAGGCPVERLRPGDRVRTADHGAQPILWTGCRTVDRTSLAASPNLLPIRFEPSALGEGYPSRPLTVSPQHRILVRSKIAERLVGDREVLVAAKHLCGLPGITVDTTLAPVTYVHILLDRHEVIFANGAGTESMLRAPMALGALSHCNRRKIETLFPARRFPKPMSPARLLVNGRIGRALAARHKRHARPLVLPDFALAD